MGIYAMPVRGKLRIVKSEERYALLCEEETARLLRMYRLYAGADVYSGACLRLSGITQRDGQTVLHTSVCGFADLLAANILRGKYDACMRYARDDKDRQLLGKLSGLFDGKRTYASFSDLIHTGNMPNCLAVSVLVRDASGNVLLARRSRNVGIAQGFCSVSCTGVSEPDDLIQEDPFAYRAFCELYEETGIRLEPSRFSVRMLAAGEEKLQPAVLLDACTDEPLEELLKKAEKPRDPEAEMLISAGKEDVIRMLESERMTEVCRAHLMIL